MNLLYADAEQNIIITDEDSEEDLKKRTEEILAKNKDIDFNVFSVLSYAVDVDSKISDLPNIKVDELFSLFKEKMEAYQNFYIVLEKIVNNQEQQEETRSYYITTLLELRKNAKKLLNAIKKEFKTRYKHYESLCFDKVAAREEFEKDLHGDSQTYDIDYIMDSTIDVTNDLKKKISEIEKIDTISYFYICPERFYNFSGCKKIFLSLPMYKKTDAEIVTNQIKLINKIRNEYGKDFVILDTDVENQYYIDKTVTDDKIGAWFLSKSIEFLLKADEVCFASDWKTGRGCRLEHEICEQYKIPILFD